MSNENTFDTQVNEMFCAVFGKIEDEAVKRNWPVSYPDDLYVHDRNTILNYCKKCIEENRVPEFAWGIRESGTYLYTPDMYKSNPYSAKSLDASGFVWFIYDSRGDLRQVEGIGPIREFLYEKAKALGLPDLSTYKITSMTVPSLHELIGSISEDVYGMVDLTQLRKEYEGEIIVMLGYARQHEDVKIWMRRFDSTNTADFCVRKTDDGTVVYNGGLHIDRHTGHVSSNH